MITFHGVPKTIELINIYFVAHHKSETLIVCLGSGCCFTFKFSFP